MLTSTFDLFAALTRPLFRSRYTRRKRGQCNELFKGRATPGTHRERGDNVMSYSRGGPLQVHTEKEGTM